MLKPSRPLHDRSLGVIERYDGSHRSRTKAIVLALAIGSAYFLAARLGLIFLAKPGLAVFWPASGIAVGAVIALGASARLPVTTAVVVATVVANVSIGRHAWLAIVFGLVNAGQDTPHRLALVERWFGRDFKREDVFQVLGFLRPARLVRPWLRPARPSHQPCASNGISPLDVWRLWFASCLLGIVTVAPLVIGLAAALREKLPRSRLIEGSTALVMLAALGVF